VTADKGWNMMESANSGHARRNVASEHIARIVTIRLQVIHMGIETGLEDDVYWREGSLKSHVGTPVCTMISPLSMLHESAEERIIEKSEKLRR
jgi:hypothetical protein